MTQATVDDEEEDLAAVFMAQQRADQETERLRKEREEEAARKFHEASLFKRAEKIRKSADHNSLKIHIGRLDEIVISPALVRAHTKPLFFRIVIGLKETEALDGPVLLSLASPLFTPGSHELKKDLYLEVTHAGVQAVTFSLIIVPTPAPAKKGKKKKKKVMAPVDEPPPSATAVSAMPSLTNNPKDSSNSHQFPENMPNNPDNSGALAGLGGVKPVPASDRKKARAKRGKSVFKKRKTKVSKKEEAGPSNEWVLCRRDLEGHLKPPDKKVLGSSRLVLIPIRRIRKVSLPKSLYPLS